MRIIAGYFDFTGPMNRKAFWKGWSVNVTLSTGLFVLWLGLIQVWHDFSAFLIVGAIRLMLILPQLSLYVRRLNDAGRSRVWIVCLLALNAVGLAVAVYLGHRAFGLFAEGSALHDPESRGDVLTKYDYAMQSAVMAGAGALMGVPGPFSLIFTLCVGTLKSKQKA